jgi:hypothetical protein
VRIIRYTLLFAIPVLKEISSIESREPLRNTSNISNALEIIGTMYGDFSGGRFRRGPGFGKGAELGLALARIWEEPPCHSARKVRIGSPRRAPEICLPNLFLSKRDAIRREA